MDTFDALLEQPHHIKEKNVNPYVTEDTGSRELSIEELVLKLNSIERSDYIVNRNELRVENHGGQIHLRVGAQVTPVTHRVCQQLNERTFGNKGRFDHLMLQKNKGVQYWVDETNRWLESWPCEKADMVRYVNGSSPTMARAIMSDCYKRVDDHVVLAPALQEAVKHGLIGIGGGNTGSSTRVKLVTKDPVLEVPLPDGRSRVFHKGFEIGNSEVGAGSFYIYLFLFDKGFCHNGSVYGKTDYSGFRVVHRGARIAQRGKITDCLEAAEVEIIRGNVRNSIEAFCSNDYHGEIVANLQAASDRQLPDGVRVRDVLQLSNKAVGLGLNKNEIDAVLEQLVPGERTHLGVQSAITAQAQQVKTYEERTRLEHIGGKFLKDMDDRRWSRVIEDAVDAAAA